jgi:hypothetical protein
MNWYNREVHRQPRADGTYADLRSLRVGETVGIGTLSDVKLAVADVVGQ